MQKIKVKVCGWEDDSQSLIACFSSDETTSSNPEDYVKLAFQPQTMFPSALTNDEIMKALAIAGMAIAEQSKVQEELKANTSRVDQFKSLVGSEQEFNVSDIIDSGSVQDIPLES